MNIETVVVGPIQTNCYLVEDAGELMVVDPGDEPGRIIEAIGGRCVCQVVLTHRHWDHTGAVPVLLEETGAPLAVHRCDAPHVFTRSRQVRWYDQRCFAGHERACVDGRVADRLLDEGDELVVGNCVFSVIHTPGHTPGSVCLYCAGQQVLLAGDTLFAGGRYGRTDFDEGSPADMRHTLQTKFASLPDEVAVLSGHEASSVLGVERRQNPYLR